MSLFGSSPRPEEVFTPRSHDLNQRTYAERPHLESRLTVALSGHKFIIICGESGNGKTWLYKKVLNREGINYQVVNLAKAHLEKSLNNVFSAKLGEMSAQFLQGEKKEFSGGVKPMGTGFDYKDTMEYKSIPLSPLEQLAQEMNMRSGGGRSVLIFDNFEQIVHHDDYLRELASVIISADEEFVARNNIKIIIVGTPTDIKTMIRKVSNASTISNRFVEIPEVARLELGEARSIMTQGFERHLKITILADKNNLYSSISHKTDRIAQHVQELCLKIAQKAAANNNNIDEGVISSAEKEWLQETLSSDMAIVEDLMNAKDTKVGRKNQVLYSLGSIEKEDFRHGDVEEVLRSKFKVEDGVNLNIPQILSSFSKHETPLIRKSGKGGRYRFCSPKTKIVIRTCLQLTSDSRVIRKN